MNQKIIIVIIIEEKKTHDAERLEGKHKIERK